MAQIQALDNEIMATEKSILASMDDDAGTFEPYF